MAGRQNKELSRTTIVQRTDEQVGTTLKDQAVILSLRTDQYFSLNEVGAFVWKIIEHPIRIEEIGQAVTGAFEVEPDRSEADVLALMRELLQEQLIRVL